MRLLALLTVVASSMCAKAPAGPADDAAACKPAPPPSDKASLERMRKQFLEKARTGGAVMSPPPALGEEPRFTELPPAQRADIERAAGSPQAAPCFYGWMYGWYLVPRELSRNLVEAANAHLAEDQQFEDDLTVAFLASQEGGEEKLASLQNLLDGKRGDDQKRILASLAARRTLQFDRLVSGIRR